MPSLSVREKKKYYFKGQKPTAEERLSRWIAKHGHPPHTIVERPLKYQLPKRVVEMNSFQTNVAFLTADGKFRLGAEDGRVIGQLVNNV